MSGFDIAVVTVIALSTVYSLFRGLVREILSLVAWVLSFWLASRYSYRLAEYLEGTITHEDLRLAVAFLLGFLAVLIVATLVNRIVTGMVRSSPLSGADRVLGAVFGAARGAVIVTLLVMLAAWTPLAGSDAWQHSHTLDYFKAIAAWAAATGLPAGIADSLGSGP